MKKKLAGIIALLVVLCMGTTVFAADSPSGSMINEQHAAYLESMVSGIASGNDSVDLTSQTVTVANLEEAYDKVSEAVNGSAFDMLAALDIKVPDGTDLTGGTNVTIYISGVEKGSNVRIFHKLSSGNWEIIAPYVGTGYVTATFYSFSPVVIAKFAGNITVAPTQQIPPNNSSSSNGSITNNNTTNTDNSVNTDDSVNTDNSDNSVVGDTNTNSNESTGGSASSDSSSSGGAASSDAANENQITNSTGASNASSDSDSDSNSSSNSHTGDSSSAAVSGDSASAASSTSGDSTSASSADSTQTVIVNVYTGTEEKVDSDKKTTQKTETTKKTSTTSKDKKPSSTTGTTSGKTDPNTSETSPKTGSSSVPALPIIAVFCVMGIAVCGKKARSL